MPIKDWVAGEQPSAADLNRYFMQQHHVVKALDESYSSATSQDDNELFALVQAGTRYWVSAFLVYEADAARDIVLRWSAPSGSTFQYVTDSITSAATTGVDLISRTVQELGSGPSGGGVGIGSAIAAVPKGVLTVGGSSGTFAFRWSQLSGGSPATVVKAGSILTLRRLTD